MFGNIFAILQEYDGINRITLKIKESSGGFPKMHYSTEMNKESAVLNNRQKFFRKFILIVQKTPDSHREEHKW